jgi:hypothetical protein
MKREYRWLTCCQAGQSEIAEGFAVKTMNIQNVSILEFSEFGNRPGSSEVDIIQTDSFGKSADDSFTKRRRRYGNGVRKTCCSAKNPSAHTNPLEAIPQPPHRDLPATGIAVAVM